MCIGLSLSFVSQIRMNLHMIEITFELCNGYSFLQCQDSLERSFKFWGEQQVEVGFTTRLMVVNAVKRWLVYYSQIDIWSNCVSCAYLCSGACNWSSFLDMRNLWLCSCDCMRYVFLEITEWHYLFAEYALSGAHALSAPFAVLYCVCIQVYVRKDNWQHVTLV